MFVNMNGSKLAAYSEKNSLIFSVTYRICCSVSWGNIGNDSISLAAFSVTG